MNFLRPLLLPLLSLLLGCAPEGPADLGVAHQPAVQEVDQILEEANRALLEARWLEFDFEYVATHAGRGRISGHAFVEPVDRDLSRSRFRIETQVGLPIAWLSDLPERVGVFQDGRTAWRVDPEAMRVERATLTSGPGWSPTVNLAGTVLPVQLFRPQPMSVELEQPTRKLYAGSASIGGVDCDVVFLAFPAESGLGEQYLYFGRDDRHLRRIVLTNVEETAMGPPMAFDLTMTDLRFGTEPATESFEPVVGSGFELLDRDLDRVGPGDPAPDWRLRNLDGELVVAADLRGSVVVLEFWATWCPTCRATLPIFERVQEELADRPVHFFAVQTWDDSDPRPPLASQGLDLEVLLDGDGLADRLKVYGTSQTVIIDPEGRIALHDLLFPLSEREQTLRDAVLTALGETAR